MGMLDNNRDDHAKKDAKIAVFGIFHTRSDLERCVDRLQADGFRNQDVSALLPAGADNMGTEKNSKAPEGAATGAGAGALLGGTLGWLVGIGSLAIPGIGPFVAAGPIMAALAGASVGAALGGISGSLIGLGIPEYEAKRYETHLKEGRHLLSIHCDDRAWKDKAENVLKACGAEDISSTGEAKAPSVKADTTVGGLKREEVMTSSTSSTTSYERGRGSDVPPPPVL